MKRSLYFLIAATALISIACMENRMSVKVLKSSMSFNKPDSQEKLPVHCILVLPKVMKDKAPLKEEDEDIWSWYFTNGFEAIFEDVTVIENFSELRNLPRAEMIVKPELRSWFLGALPQAQRDEALWHCKMEFKFQFYNALGDKTTSISVEKQGWGRERVEALSDAMNGLINQLRVRMKEIPAYR